MENLKQNFLNLYENGESSKIIKKHLKTGVVYHEDMLKHRTDPDDEICKNHVENPNRLSSIINLLEKKKGLDNCIVNKEMEEIDLEHVKNIHGEEYVNYLQKLLTENFDNYAQVYASTYYNKDTLRAARLAAEATKLASEKVFLGEWKNSFSLVRPPGHHAAANDTIGGFCFMNNVAIAAEYLIRKFDVKKIAVLDWDVHHGDSTQKLFYERNDVLYISIHKFCYGKFYPGLSGNNINLGEGPGKGYNLNFPINPLKNQFVGDEDYIFTFERMILPILIAYQPEFVFISSGFDCLYGDPLGEFKVTQDSLMYMLYRIQNRVTSKINVVLEGGYNLKKISEASLGILKVLKGNFLSNLSNKIELNLYHLKFDLKPLPIFIKNLRENLVFWETHWKDVLNTPHLVEFDKRVIDVVNLGKDFAGGHWKRMYREDGKFFKLLKNKELDFFRKIYPNVPELHPLMPEFYGFLEKNEKTYCIMEDLNSDGNYNIMDIKITDFYNAKYHLSKFFRKNKTNFSGYSIKNVDGVTIEKRRGYFNRIEEEDFLETFKRFFRNSKGRVNYGRIEEIVNFIDKIIKVYYPNNYLLSQCSLFILFDAKTENFKIKLIDYAYFEIYRHQNLLVCFKNLKKLLKNLINENKLVY